MKTNSSYMTKTYPPSTLDALTRLEKEIDELVSSDPTPKDLDEYLLKQMDNSEWDQIKVVTPPSDNPIYIVAGNHEEFENYVLKKNQQMVNKQNYIYVKNRYDLMGLTEIKGYYIGTAFQREDINQIKQAIAYVKERAELLGKDTTYTFSQLFATQWDTEDM
jgi:hypothetical protein